MITLMIVASLLVIIAGLFTLKHAVKHAATGYEDEFGFHEGADPQLAGSLHSALETQEKSTARNGTSARRMQKRKASKSLHQGSAAPFQVG